jgi:TRAP-type mannitol/chloroaromatic compound transport system permease large subunit
MVIFILIGSTVFSLVFQGVDGNVWIEHMLSHLPGGQVGFLVVVNLFVFFLAFFLDFFEIAFIIVPMLAPVADKLGIDLVWFGVLLCVNMQTSFMHPPFASRCSTCAASPTRSSRRVRSRFPSGPATSTWEPSPGSSCS